MKSIKGLSGFGDAIYLRVAVEWMLINMPDQYLVTTNYPDVFRDLDVKTIPFNRGMKAEYNFTYLLRKYESGSTQFSDMCVNAGIGIIPFESKLAERRPSGLTVVNNLYSPLDGCDPVSDCLRPRKEDYESLVSNYKNVVYLKEGKYKFIALVNILNRASLFITQQGWGTAIAEMLNVPTIICFTKRGYECSDPFFSSIKPEKIIEKKTTTHIALP